MANKKKFGLIAVLALVMTAAFFAGCSTAPVVPLASNQINYTILGRVDGGPWASQAAALEAAKAKYPDADAVIAVTGKGDDQLIPQKLKLGYFAIKFNEQPDAGAAKKGFFG